jgi:coenzyme F420-0:L-glutamate ligase/coenzyme F420-1:gamma-L-glutamate ligase
VTVELVPIEGLPDIVPGVDLASVLAVPLRTAGLADGDVVVVTSKIVSKSEGRLVPGTDRAAAVAAETVRVVARRGDLVIAETRHGFVCANAGVDASNLEDGVLALLPEDPDRSAAALLEALEDSLGLERLGVVITDTFGRAWRTGLVNVAIGCAGLPAVIDLRGRTDHHGRLLEATIVAYADEIAAASGLVMAKDARVPVAIVRGLAPPDAPPGPATDLIRPPDEDLFRTSPLEALRAAPASAFAPGEVPRATLEEAIAVAASGAGALPAGTAFAVVASPEGLRALGRAVPVPHGTAAVIGVTIAGERDGEVAVAAVIGERLRLALEALGLGSDRIPAGDDDRTILAALGGGAGSRAIDLLAVGRAPEGAAPSPRPPVDPSDLTSWR